MTGNSPEFEPRLTLKQLVTAQRCLLTGFTFLSAVVTVLDLPQWLGSPVIPAFVFGFLAAAFTFVLPDIWPRDGANRLDAAERGSRASTGWLQRVRADLEERCECSTRGVDRLTLFVFAVAGIAFLNTFVLVCILTIMPFPLGSDYSLAALCGLIAAVFAGRSVRPQRPKTGVGDEVPSGIPIARRLGRFVRGCFVRPGSVN